MKNKFLAIAAGMLLVVSMFAAAAFAEGFSDMTVTMPSGETYTFPMSLEACAAAGLELPELAPLSAGQYYPDVDASNGREVISLRVVADAATGELYATGCMLNVNETAGASVCGLAVGECTQTDVVDLLGTDIYGNNAGAGSSLSYNDFHNMYSCCFEFDSDSADATAKYILLSCEIPSTYGTVYSDAAGVEEAGLPASTDLAFNQFILDGKLYQSGDTLQKLLDNGWILPASRTAEDSINARSGSRASGDSFYMYNGTGLVKVSAYNLSEENSTLAACTINEIIVEDGDQTTLIAADGIQPGVTAYADAAAILGEVKSQSTNDDGSTTYTFVVLNNLNYEITEENGKVTAVSIRGLMNN